VVDPVLNAGPEPLMVGIVDESLRHRVAVRYQALQHHGQIDVRDRQRVHSALSFRDDIA
jgi:hypothetical protein